MKEKEYIQILRFSEDEKEAEAMQERGVVAEIERQGNKTTIYVRKDVARIEDLAHEFGHYFQFILEDEGFFFSDPEYLAYKFEDLLKSVIRKLFRKVQN
jgi:hypothetical protein